MLDKFDLYIYIYIYTYIYIYIYIYAYLAFLNDVLMCNWMSEKEFKNNIQLG